MTRIKKELEQLNLLLESYLEAKNTYLQISEEERDLEVKRFYNTQITLRNKFVNDIKGIIRSLGGKPSDGSVAGNIQRNISEIMANIIPIDSKKALGKCLKKDGTCIKIANEFIKNSTLSNEVISVLFSQRNKMIDACGTAQDFLSNNKDKNHLKVVAAK